MARTLSSYSGKGSGIGVTCNFNDLLEKIKKANGDIESATWKACRAGAREMHDVLEAEASKSGLPTDVTDALIYQADRDSSGNRYACVVGWRLGSYDPEDLSAGYKAVFVNYGTPRRTVETEGVRVQIDGEWKTLDTNRGFIDGTGFIGRAKKKARKKVKQAQEEALNEILSNLRGG